MSMQTSAQVSCSLKTSVLIQRSPSSKLHAEFFSNPIYGLRPAANHKAYHGCSLRWARSSFSPLRRARTTNSGNYRSKMDFVVYSSNQAGDLDTWGILLDSWKNWIPGILATIIVPFYANKWGPFAKLKDEVDMVEETIVKIVDEVEEVAEKVEKVVEDIASDLPDGKLKNALNLVDKVAKETVKDAQLAEDVVNKVEEVEKEVESLVDSIAGSDKSNATTKLD